MIMAGHFLGAIKYSPDFSHSFITALAESRFGFLINESFWLTLFFVTSGYLLSLSEIDSFRSLILKSVKRFLRLGIPVLFSCAVIYVFILCVGLHNSETDALFENTRLQAAFSVPLTLWRVLLSPIHVLVYNICTFNSPYWVLRDMLLNSLLIFLCLFLQSKTRTISWIKYVFICALVLFGFWKSYITISFTFGMVIAQHEQVIRRLFTSFRWLPLSLVAFTALLYFFFPASILRILLFGVLIAAIPYIPLADRILSRGIPQFLGKISFGIYSFHWPVFCSVGAWALLFFTPELGIWWAFAISAVSSVATTLVLSFLYNLTLEKLSNQIIEKVIATIAAIPKRKNAT